MERELTVITIVITLLISEPTLALSPRISSSDTMIR